MVRISNYLKGLTLVSMMSVATMTLQSCSDSDNFTAVDNADPTLLLSQSTILTEPGRAFTIEGIAKDADGLKSIRLVNDDLYLDKTIDFLTYYPDSLLHEYHLNYGYNGDKTWTGTESFPIQITVEDVMGTHVHYNSNRQHCWRFLCSYIYYCSVSKSYSIASKSEANVKHNRS